ncbi:MAG: carboxypeptidase-like regulatory domain-containing protein [bacterium]
MKNFFIFILFLPLILNAGTTGKLTGSITDASSGEPLIGANIVVEGTSLGAATDYEGNYVILNIRPGSYSVRISSIGYKSTVVEDVRIVVDRTTNISLSLEPTSVQLDDIIIRADTKMIQKDLTSSIAVMTRDEIEELPVSDFSQLLQLQAGVVGSGKNLHIRGGRSNEVAYLIDGMYVQDPLLGGLATGLSNDAIQEMSLLSGTFNAEYGNSLSGVVNIVTREGGDDFNGRIEMRTSEFGIKEFSDLHEMRINANLSGPLFTNDLKFFAAVEKDRNGSYLPFGYDKSLSLFGKLSYSGIKGIKITFSNRSSSGKRQNYNHSYRYIPDQYLRNRTDSYQSTLALTHTLASNLFYDLRFSYFNQGYYSGLDKDTSEYIAASDAQYLSDIGTGFEFYSRSDPPSLTDSRTATAEVKGDLVWQMNQLNEIKFGFQYKKHWLRYWNIYDPKRDFPYINNYNTSPFEAAGYLQDKIEFPFLVINLGLRFDYVNANVIFRNNPLDPNSLIQVKPRYQISPRVGIAHPISENTKLHFSYGHFFQNPDYQYFFENSQYDLHVREPLMGQPNLDAMRTISYEVGISHQFTERIAMHVTAYYKDETGKIGTRYYFPFVDGRYTGYTLYVNEDYTNTKGFEVNLDVRSSRYFSGGLTYTFSFVKGSASSEQEQYPGTDESTLLYYLDWDKPHVLNASATFFIPEGEGPEIFGKTIFEDMDISLIFKASSGYPYTPGGRDVGFVVKNSLRMPSVYNIDIEIGKEFDLFSQFKARIFCEILNLTNHRNVIYVYSDTGDPEISFAGDNSLEYLRDPSNYGPPRSVRLGLGIRF